jgi:hypothetical protein
MATKTGGGLLGRADSTLVQGALKTELANIAPDMRGIYKMQAENVTNLQTAVQDFFYAFDKSNNDLENEVKELTPKLLADIETGTYIDDSYVDLVSQEINSLRQQMKLIPKGREGEAERAKIKTKLANIKAESGSAEQTMTKIATLIDNDQIDFNSLQTGDMELWKSILNKTAKREFVDGKLVYSANINGKELKISHSDLEKRFLPKQYGVQSNALKLSNGFINVGKQGLEYDFNGAMNAYETLMTNKQEVLGLINNPFGSMQYSFKDALKGKDPNLTKELISALNNVGGFDVDNDGTPDQITMSNLNKLVSTLTNPDDENFNLATTKRIAAAFYADNDGRIQYNKGKSLFDAQQRKQKESQTPKTDKFGGFSQYSDTGGDPDADVNSFQSIPYSDKVTRRKSLLNLETIPGAHYTYKYDGNNEGGWQAFDGTKFVRNMNGADVARIEGLMSANDSSFSDFNVGKVKSDLDEKELQPKKPGTVGLGSINIEGNTTKDQVRRVANNLEEVFDENFKNEFDISVVSQNRIGGGGMFGGSSRTTTTPNKIRIKSKDGSFDKIYDIGPNATQKTVDQINIDFADYIAIDSSYED